MATDPGAEVQVTEAAAPGERSGAPLVGISAYCEQARWGVWDMEAMVLPRRYPDRVAQAGGIPVLLPPTAGIEDALPRLDCLVLSGGGDIDPAHYGAPRMPGTTSVREDRDAAELALLKAALARRMPILGICRGMQLINVALGGSLHQHLPDVVGHDEHAPTPGTFGSHEVKVAAGSRLAAILGHTDLDVHLPAEVPTHHHQGINRLGAGLTATAWAADGTVEAFELDPAECPFGVAVQWHPEAGDDLRLFAALVDAARLVPTPGG
jgi:putative glutamine amidotransferase